MESVGIAMCSRVFVVADEDCSLGVENIGNDALWDMLLIAE